jgi:hypothetical protein
MPSASTRSAAQSVARRTLAAAFVGLVLPLLAWAITMAGLAALPYETSGGAGGWGRVGQGIVILAAAVLFLLVAAWPLLWALRVRPAWHVALLAPITAIILAIALSTVAGQIIGTSIATGCVALALAYGLTALLTTPGRPWWWQQVPLAAVGGPLPIPAASPPSHLPDLGIPLIAPDLAGYTIERLSARPGDLRYLLRPALHRAATSAEREASTITTIVRSRVPAQRGLRVRTDEPSDLAASHGHGHRLRDRPRRRHDHAERRLPRSGRSPDPGHHHPPTSPTIPFHITTPRWTRMTSGLT